MLSRVETLLMINHLKHWGLIVMDNLFPRFCIACQRRLLLNERYICIDCLCDMPFTHFNGEKGNIIERITCDDVVSTERANSLLFYRSQSKFCHIYFHFKYHNHPEVAVEMGRMMANELKDTDFLMALIAWCLCLFQLKDLKSAAITKANDWLLALARLQAYPLTQPLLYAL